MDAIKCYTASALVKKGTVIIDDFNQKLIVNRIGLKQVTFEFVDPKFNGVKYSITRDDFECALVWGSLKINN
jgi:hypothetical protein